MPSLRERLLVVILALIGALAWWLQQEPEKAPTDSRDALRRPDYTVYGVTATTMEETGRPDRRLIAEQLRHYPDDDSSELDRPVLTIFAETAPPWVIRSDTGWISAEGDEIILQGRVFIDREPGVSTRPVHLKTWDLHVHPEEEYAQTREPVEAISNADWLTSMGGAEVWFGDQAHINLIGRINARMRID
jgi:lipopolysaccharide export system protein LptC